MKIPHTATKLLSDFKGTAFGKETMNIMRDGGIKNTADALKKGGIAAGAGAIIGGGIGAYSNNSSLIGGAFAGAALGLGAGGIGVIGKGFMKDIEEGAVAAPAIAAAKHSTPSTSAGKTLKERALNALSAGVGVAREAKFAVGETIRGMKSYIQKNEELLNTVPTIENIQRQQANHMFGFGTASKEASAADLYQRRTGARGWNGTSFR